MGGDWYAWRKTQGEDIPEGMFRIVNSDGSYNQHSSVLYKYTTSTNTMSSLVDIDEYGYEIWDRNWYLKTTDGNASVIDGDCFPFEDY